MLGDFANEHGRTLRREIIHQPSRINGPAMIYAQAIRRFPLGFFRFSLRTTKRTLVWSLTIVWLLLFVLVLIPLAWLALAIVARW